jgi:V/A-type H+-transporting ATPase subunit I
MYSLPGHKETDPNLIMAPFYIVFFGIMLGDVGYGLILALLCGLLLWKANLKAGMKKVMSLLFFCGISTIICGLLFGSIFGDAIAVISGKPINTDVLFNPIEFPEKMLIISLALGVLQIFTGIGMKGYNLIKNGNTFDGILDTITLYMFLAVERCMYFRYCRQ